MSVTLFSTPEINNNKKKKEERHDIIKKQKQKKPQMITALWGTLEAARKVSEGVAFELNQPLKINWSTELEGEREKRVWEDRTLRKKANNLSQGMGTKKSQRIWRITKHFA